VPENAGILAAQIIATGNPSLLEKILTFKQELAKKIEKANKELATIKFDYKTN